MKANAGGRVGFFKSTSLRHSSRHRFKCICQIRRVWGTYKELDNMSVWRWSSQSLSKPAMTHMLCT